MPAPTRGKLPHPRYRAWRALRAQGLTLQAIADQYGVTRQNVSDVLGPTRKSSRHGTMRRYSVYGCRCKACVQAVQRNNARRQGGPSDSAD